MGFFPRELDLIKYGCPTIEQDEWLKMPSYLDDLFKQIVTNGKHNPPANSSLQTRDELTLLMTNTKKIIDNPSVLDRYKEHDVGLVEFLKDGVNLAATKFDIDAIRVNRLIDDVLFDTLGLITKLKYHYQRPRPYQMAVYYDMDFHHHQSITIDSPSYPSGHAYMGTILSGVVGMVAPEIFLDMKKASYDFNFSRLFMGVHYKSEVDKCVEIAEMVLSNPNFIRKHRL